MTTNHGIVNLKDLIQALYIMEMNKIMFRRVTDPQSWACNIRHCNRIAGEEYINMKKETVPTKMENCKCCFQCDKHFLPDCQRIIFEHYWKLGDTAHQKVFLASLIEEKRSLLSQITKKRGKGAKK